LTFGAAILRDVFIWDITSIAASDPCCTTHVDAVDCFDSDTIINYNASLFANSFNVF